MKNHIILTFALVFVGVDLFCFYIGRFFLIPYIVAAIFNAHYLSIFVPIFGQNALYRSVDYGMTIYPLGWILIFGLFLLVGTVLYLLQKVLGKS